MNTTAEKSITLAALPSSWSAEHLSTIRKTICHPSMSEIEIALFLEQCRRTELDPLKGEAFCVPRRVKITVNGHDEWVERYTFQPAEAGMAVRGAKFPDYRGIRSGVFFEEDKMLVVEVVDPANPNESLARIEHSYAPNKPRGKLVGAWALVDREGFRFSPEIVYRQEYEQRNGKGEVTKAWQKPHTMIVKCARSAAWRRAFPDVFAGVYSREEMEVEHDAEVEERAPTGAIVPGRSKGDEIAEKMKVKLAGLRPQTVQGTVAARAEPERVAAKPTPPKDVAKAAVGEVERRLAAFLDQEEVKKGSKLTRDEEKKLTEQFLARETKTAAGQITNGDMDRAGPPPVEESTAVGDDSPRLTFGPASIKGKSIKQLATDDLIGAASVYEEILEQATGEEPSLPKLKTELEAIDAELKKREAEQ